MKSRTSNKKPVTNRAAIIVALITSFATIITALVSILPSLYSGINPSSNLNMSSEDYTKLESEIKGLSTQITKINKDIVALQKNPSLSDVSLELSRLNSSIQETKTKIEKMEAIIIDTPEDAISLPLLQKDLDNTKIVFDTKIVDLEKSVNNAYTIVVGVLVVIGLGFLGIAGTNFLSNRTTKDEESSNNDYELGKLAASLDELNRRVATFGSIEEKINKLSATNQELYDGLTQLRDEITEVKNLSAKTETPSSISANENTGENKS